MGNTVYAVLTLLPVVAWYLYTQLVQWRFKKFSHIPQVLPKTLLLGHLKSIADLYQKFGDPRYHIGTRLIVFARSPAFDRGLNMKPDYILEEMFKTAGDPEILTLDMRPVMYPMVVVASHEVAEQCTRATKIHPYSLAKSPTYQQHYRWMIGKESMLSKDHETWKELRKRFNPGFAPQHILSLLPQILEKTSTFTSKLDALATSGEAFSMEDLCVRLTFDIIGKVVTNLDFHAQDSSAGAESDIFRHFRTLMTTFSNTGALWLWLNVPKHIQRRICSYQTDTAIKRCIIDKFAEIKAAQSTETKSTKDRSVLALALQDTDSLTPEVLQSTTDQVRSFLFAGHDTTSTLLQRVFYALSLDPKRLAIIRAEHESIFGDQDPHAVFLARPEETLKAMHYTSACIKEALRLWPPAGSARMTRPGEGFKLRLANGEQICIDNTVIYLNQYLIHRDPKVFGANANDFVPERWLGDTDTSAAGNEADQVSERKIPISAWRPFERGPRNCIGQELANLEARVIIACVMRRYDFTKVGAGEVERDEKGMPMLDERGVYKTKSVLFNSEIITAKPFDHCQMRIRMHQSGA